jgi:hypothetical protein
MKRQAKVQSLTFAEEAMHQVGELLELTVNAMMESRWIFPLRKYRN